MKCSCVIFFGCLVKGGNVMFFHIRRKSMDHGAVVVKKVPLGKTEFFSIKKFIPIIFSLLLNGREV